MISIIFAVFYGVSFAILLGLSFYELLYRPFFVREKLPIFPEVHKLAPAKILSLCCFVWGMGMMHMAISSWWELIWEGWNGTLNAELIFDKVPLFFLGVIFVLPYIPGAYSIRLTPERLIIRNLIFVRSYRWSDLGRFSLSESIKLEYVWAGIENSSDGSLVKIYVLQTQFSPEQLMKILNKYRSDSIAAPQPLS